MSVKRYEWVACDEHACHCDVVESAEGDMVDYEDYAALEQNLAESQREFRAADATIENLQMQVEKLAAENAGMKAKGREVLKEAAYVYSHYNRMTDHLDGESVDGQTLHEFQFLLDCETPATDAFLAEVRAQVWIEGNEPAEFGRYWVRYETDVGPQYCSAQWLEHNFCAGSDSNIHKIWLADHSRSINSLRGVTHYTKLPDSLEAAQ
ncbi:hypothetical protein ACXVQ8_21100 [Enterobacter hormaechei subsp. xiangfangensis]